MRVPAVLPIKNVKETDRAQIRAFFRNLVASRFVQQTMGQEASEERLEVMFDEGWLKIAVEPGPAGLYYWRVLLYDERIKGYSVTDQIKFIISDEPQPKKGP